MKIKKLVCGLDGFWVLGGFWVTKKKCREKGYGFFWNFFVILWKLIHEK